MAANPPAARFAETHHRLTTTAAVVVLFWLAAAGAAAAAQMNLGPIPATVATIAAILLAAYGYTRFCARQAGISHALGVGIAWLALSIISEIVLAAQLDRGWYAVLGSPARPLLRNLFFFVWIFGPALFARREDGD
jgi:hypothetical protein